MNIIKNSKADRKGPHTLISSIGGVIVLLALALMLSSCGKDSSGHGKGAIAFSIKMPAQPASQLLYKAAAIPCIEYGITSVDARVYDSVENLVATGGPWPCDTGEGTISGIEEGSGYIVSLSLKDSDGNVVLRGSSDPLQVVAGQVTDAEIELTSSNNPPVFESIANQKVSELQPLSFTVNASDPDGNKLTYSATNLPAGATFDPSSRFFYWIPGYDQGGSYTVGFQVTDDGTPPLSAAIDVTITVGDINRPPVLTAPTSVNFDTLTSSLLSFQVSATDPDSGDILTFYAADLPRDSSGSYLSGVNFDPATQTFTWTDASAPSGEYKVLFIVTDNGTPRMSDYAWVSIQRYRTTTAVPTNYGPHYPILAPINSRQIAPGEEVGFTVTATDSDGNPINYLSASIAGKQPPTGYTFDSTGTHAFSWSSTGTPGNYWLRFSATDAVDGLSDYEDVVFTVGNVNRPPALDPIGRRTARNNQPIEFVVTATDPNNDALTYSMSSPSAGVGLPSGVAFDAATQTFTWTPSLIVTPPVSYTIRFSVADDGSPSESDYEDVVITVLP